MTRISWTTAPGWRQQVETAIVCLALAIAAVVLVSTTIAPSEHIEIARTPPAKSTPPARTCPRLCGFNLPANKTVEPAVQTVGENPVPAKAPSAAKTDTKEKTASETDTASSTIPPDEAKSADTHAAIASNIEHTKAVAPETDSPVDEPITTRPVADRFDFISPQIHKLIAEYEAVRPSRRFASLPATELQAVSPTQLEPPATANREIAMLQPETTLTAVVQRTPVRATKAPQVAGWSLVRTIKTEEFLQGPSLIEVTPDELPVRRPNVPRSYRAAPSPKISQSKKTRRARKRKKKTFAAKKAKPPAKKNASDRSWETNALFRDN